MGIFGHKHTKYYIRMRTKIRVMFLQDKGYQSLSTNHQKLGRSNETDFPSQASEGTNPPEPETINLSLVT